LKLLVASTHVPFAAGGARTIARDLVDALRLSGHEVDTLELPRVARWDAVLEQALAFRLLDVGQDSDLLMAIGSPSHVLRHPCKRLWLIDEHSANGDVWGIAQQEFPSTPAGSATRDAMRRANELYLSEAQQVFTSSAALAERLQEYNGLGATVLELPTGGSEDLNASWKAVAAQLTR
jgi:hypothetical protein